MTSFYYLVWALLPLLLFIFALWALIRPYVGIRGKEGFSRYFYQAIFCSIALVIAICIDKYETLNDILDSLSYSFFDLRLAKWLIYPLVLLFASWVDSFLSKK